MAGYDVYDYRNRELETMSTRLLLKAKGSQSSAILSLLHSAEEQSFQQCLLCYHLLSRAPKPLSLEELRVQACNWLGSSCGIAVSLDNFCIYDSVSRLRGVGLIETNDRPNSPDRATGRESHCEVYSALPLGVAASILKNVNLASSAALLDVGLSC
jgi:hypothetical protein